MIRGVIGVCLVLLIATLLSTGWRQIRWQTIAGALGFNLLFALLVLRTEPGRLLFQMVSAGLLKIVSFAAQGSHFVFGPLLDGFSRIPGFSGSPYVFVLDALLPIIFFSTLINMLYYLGIMQRLVRGLALLFSRLFGISGTEATVTASNIFLGQTEAAMTVGPYIKTMTESELFLTMTTGMATVGSGLLVVYSGMGARMEYVLAASIMAAPAAVAIAKLMVPEQNQLRTDGMVELEEQEYGNGLLDSAAKGAMQGWHILVAVTVMLLAFIPLIHLADWLIATLSNNHSDLQTILTWLFTPAAWIAGVPASDTASFAKLLGTKTAFNEVIAFSGIRETALSPKGFMLACFALTGFANLSSIAIQIGGIGALAPEKRSDIARLGLKALLAATLANLLSATIAGIFF
jgi:CNT family concentrative nucleoside transporter